QFIARRLAERQADLEDRDDLLGFLLSRNSGETPGAPINPQELRDQLVTLLFAAYETTAATLIWSGWLLARHPAVQDEIAEGTVATAAHSAVTSSARQDPGLLERCVKESLRMYPPVYFLSREVSESVEIGGFRLEPKSQVYLSTWLTHRDSRWFDQPAQFDPARFTPEREQLLPAGAWIPFGAGPRACIGRGWAMDWVKCILWETMKRYRLTTDVSSEPTLAWKLSLQPEGRLPIAIEPRKSPYPAETSRSF
ncbi:MAG: cytochrome P450, partial [Planctomycetaceae bacterium]